MKKSLLALAAVASFSISNAWAVDGTINFQGEILANACTVTTGADGTQNVSLGRIAATGLPNAGATAAASRFSIILSACPDALTGTQVRFDGRPDPSNSDYLGLSSTGNDAASGVAVRLMTANRELLPLGSLNTHIYTLRANTNNTLDFYAQYYRTAEAAYDLATNPNGFRAGVANATATFTVNYN